MAADITLSRCGPHFSAAELTGEADWLPAYFDMK